MGQAIGGMLGDLPSIVDPHLLAGGGALAAAPLIGKMVGKVDDVADAARMSGQADDLLALHNLSPEKLAYADRVGGLAAPSIAVTKPDIPFGSYGDISLIAPKDLVDPQTGAKVFASDVYSPRYPDVTHDIPSKTMNRLYKDLEGPGKDLRTSISSMIDESMLERKGAEALERSPTMMLAYAREKGLPLDPIPGAKYSPAELQEFQLKARNAGMEWNETRNIDAPQEVQEAAWKKFRQAEYAERDARRANERGVDDYGISLTERFRNDKDYLSWARAKFAGLGGKEKIFKGYSNTTGEPRYVPHTLENAVKEMTKDIRGGESFNYGAGSVRAAVTPQFKSIAAMKARSGSLVPKEQFDTLKDEVNKELVDLADRFKSDAHSFSVNLQEAGKRGNVRSVLKSYYPNMGDNDAKAAAEFLDKLKNMPTEYFEAKIPRAVRIGEFKAALVPDDVSQETLDILKRSGVSDVRKYKRGDEQARKQAMRDVGQSGLKFGIGGIALYGASGEREQ
jgi:hypothetical protein